MSRKQSMHENVDCKTIYTYNFIIYIIERNENNLSNFNLFYILYQKMKIFFIKNAFYKLNIIMDIFIYLLKYNGIYIYK